MWSNLGYLAIFAFHNILVLQIAQHHHGRVSSSSSSSSRTVSSSWSSSYTPHRPNILCQGLYTTYVKKLQEENDEYKDDARFDTIAKKSPGRRHMFSTLLASVGSCCTASKVVHAISSTEAESSYDKYASTYDALDGGSLADSLGIERARSKIISMARGNVLEIGAGTGLNLEKYRFASSPQHAMDGVTSLTLLDVSEGMMSQAREKLKDVQVPDYVNVRFVKADATNDLIELYGREGYFDTVVDTFSLCVMGNQGAKDCLRQIQQVVKKDSGRILLIENARSSNAAFGLYQDWTANAAAKMGGKGCVSNQNVGEFIRNVDGLEIVDQEEYATGVFRSYICKRTM